MDHIKNLKMKGLKLLLCYYSGSERLKGGPKKLELLEAVTGLLERIGRVLCRGRGLGGLLYQMKLVVKLVHRWEKDVGF